MAHPDGRLAGKVALLTGGANGIGLACAERFAEEGARVVIADLLDEPGEAAAEKLRGQGHEAVFVHLDAASPTGSEAAVQAAVATFDRLDVLVTAAGISFTGYTSGDHSRDEQILAAGASVDQATAFLNLPLEGWYPVLDVNLTGTLLAVQAAGRRMVAQGEGGSIVTVASIASLVPEGGTLAYSVSKAGVWMVTKMAAMSLGPQGIRVNAVGPGFVETNMTKILLASPERPAKLLESVPMGRFGQPREIADVALFLASDEASYVTGELMIADGGFYTH
jgi:NAD(P)-dependent dehydrogenase (short-subunit alcohol dehydrogenase family)